MLKQVDKQLHFLVGLVIALACGYFVPWWAGLVAATAIGAGKEVYDSAHKDEHTPDVWDFVVTALGGLLGAGVVLLGDY